MLRAKLGEEIEPYLIPGAGNPQLAHRGLEIEPDLGVLLPCNVVVRRPEGSIYVAAIEPMSALQLADNPELEPIAQEARERLERAFDSGRVSAVKRVMWRQRDLGFQCAGRSRRQSSSRRLAGRTRGLVSVDRLYLYVAIASVGGL